ncbi:MAG: c-type cytochrome [Planctomycetota bacterium]|jgi:cytochrome c5|nr:c-type cytochrome [Planctomycetota bacterium]MDP6941299.1 c-type cytochrome [Planctomycetota bacterium]
MKTTAIPFFVLLLTACGGEEAQVSASSTPDAPAPIPAEATQIYDTFCTTCHGKTGVGDGAAAVALDPKPRNYQDKAWQASVSDEQLAKTIVEGGPAVGLSSAMPPRADLKDKPDVVAGLVQIIRGFGE